MAGESTRVLVDALRHVQGRAQAARALAVQLGAQDLALYVRDPGLNVMLPAPGMPKTVAGGPLWRSFLARCLQGGRFSGPVDIPAGNELAANALVVDGVAAVLLGGRPRDDAVNEFQACLPLLAALLCAEQAAQREAAEAAEAREAAARAHALARALDAARAAAAQLNQELHREHERKDEFLAMLAHELRNPLSPLLNALEILLREPLAGEGIPRRQLDVMARQLQQLTRLVDDLLDVSRVSRGQIDLRRESLRLDDVLQDAIEGARPAIEARRHSLHVSGLAHDTALYVNGDRVRLAQVFTNLLNNAAKYTDPGGQISISLVHDSGRASVVIRDNGVGIPPDMLSRVFDLFTQVPVSLDRAQGGLGIGLTLVRTLVTLHGGLVTAHSVGLGQGSTFTVSLPLVEAPREPAGHRTGSPPGQLARASGVKVLVVDDNRDGAATLADILSLMGATTSVAHAGQQALELALEWAPALVLLDIGLPGMDGYETARRLRQLPGFQARLVALTGYGSPRDRARSLAAGFDAHLVKPVSRDQLEELLSPFAPVPRP